MKDTFDIRIMMEESDLLSIALGSRKPHISIRM